MLSLSLFFNFSFVFYLHYSYTDYFDTLNMFLYFMTLILDNYCCYVIILYFGSLRTYIHINKLYSNNWFISIVIIKISNKTCLQETSLKQVKMTKKSLHEVYNFSKIYKMEMDPNRYQHVRLAHLKIINLSHMDLITIKIKISTNTHQSIKIKINN